MMEWIHSKGRVVVDAKTLLLPDLLRIYNDDETELKTKANILLSYIHLVSQIDDAAPYFKSSSTQVRELAKKSLFGNPEFQFQPEVDAFIENTIKEYQEAFEEVDARAKRIFKKKIDNILDKIDSTEVQVKETTTRNGTVFSSNFAILNKMMSEVMPLIDAESELGNRIKKMGSDGSKVRGDKRVSLLTKRLNTRNKQDKQDEGNS